MMRAFLAVEMPDVLRPGLDLIQGELKKSNAEVRWVPVGNIHLTLKFFGNIADTEIDPLTLAAQAAAAQVAPFQLKVTIAGAFPSIKAPRVVWVGIGGDVLPLTQLYQKLEKAFTALGHLPEGRAFHPHLTLGRVKSSVGREQLKQRLEKLGSVDWPPFPVKELVLFRSVLSPQGSTYTPLKVIPLGK